MKSNLRSIFAPYTSSSIRINEESKSQVWYELKNPTPIRRKRPGESKQSKLARSLSKKESTRKEAEEERCKERERLTNKLGGKKTSMPRSHNYRRKVLITKHNEKNYYKNKSSLLVQKLEYYRLCVSASRTRRVKGKGRKSHQCSYIARVFCEKNYDNENTPGKTGFDNAMMYLATQGLADDDEKTMKKRRRKRRRRKRRRRRSNIKERTTRISCAPRGEVARIARRQARIENEIYNIRYHKHRVRQGMSVLFMYVCS